MSIAITKLSHNQYQKEISQYVIESIIKIRNIDAIKMNFPDFLRSFSTILTHNQVEQRQFRELFITYTYDLFDNYENYINFKVDLYLFLSRFWNFPSWILH